uniref:Uncharacterized protein n=1 Tax=viral metagenome TaxID=1070528 RepID=A0A6H1ZQT0_9ZZZZ
MAKKEKNLEIYAPSQGLAISPHRGYANLRNLDIFSVPGIAKLNNILSKKSSTTITAQIKWIVKNPASPANIYAIDSNGVVYNSTDSGATWVSLSDRAGAGEGAVVWKDYLIVATTTGLDTYGPLSGTPAWSAAWQTIDTGAWHPMLTSKLDGKVYGGAGRYVFTIEENSGQNFAPGTAATYTFTQQALDLPEDYKIKCLEELGNNLLCGTWQGMNVYDVKEATIFPWDGTSTTYGQPIIIKEHGCHGLLTEGNIAYVLAGIEGIIYKTNGVSAWPVAQIPSSVCDISNTKYLEFYPGAFINYKGRPFFGVSSQNVAGMGVWSLMETSKGTILNHEHSISTLTDGGTNPLIIGALLGITRDTLLVGWRDNVTYGIDKTNPASFAYGTDYSGYFESALYWVGGEITPRTFEQLEFFLAKELAATEGVKIDYRVNLTDSFTEIDTYTTTEMGTSQSSHEDEAAIPSCQMVQIKVSLKGTSTTTPSFRLLTLK